MSQYVTTDQLRERLASDSSFTQEVTAEYEAFLDTACTNASAIVDAYIGAGRPFSFETLGTAEAPVTRTYTGDDSDYLYPDLPLQTFVSATNDDTDLTSADVWLEDVNDPIKRCIILKDGTWSSTRQSITISGVWGWGAPPAEVVEATVETAVRIVKGRAAGYSDTVGVDAFGGSGDLVQRYVKALSPLVKLTLDKVKQRVESFC